MNLIETLNAMAKTAEMSYLRNQCAEPDKLNLENREAIETVRAMQEALRDALPFVAYAYSQRLQGAEDVGRSMEEALRRAEGYAG